MDRRKFLQLAALGSAGALPLLQTRVADAVASDLKITRVRVFKRGQTGGRGASARCLLTF